MRLWISAVVLALLAGSSTHEVAAQSPSPAPTLSSDIPHDVLLNVFPGYSGLDAANQRAFDEFSWQSFVALNWPADLLGRPLNDSILTRPLAPRVWQFYKTPQEVFDAGRTHPLGTNNPAQRSRIFRMMVSQTSQFPIRGPNDSFLEATGSPLIDRNLNFVMYDIVLNDVEYKYIKANGLDTKAGQQAFMDKGKTVSFPLGVYADPIKKTGGSVGAIEIKTSWRMLDPKKDDLTRFYTVNGIVYVDAQNTVSRKPLFIASTMGLVGMHIIQRVTGPYSVITRKPTGNQFWVWSTFEHVDNAPLAANARDATDITLPLPTSGTAPAKVDRTYSFYNPLYKGPTNVAPVLKSGESNFLWNDKPPYAARYATDGKFGTQVVRDWKIFPETAAVSQSYQSQLSGDSVSKYFRGLLGGTVWANYELIGSQWMGGIEQPSTENGNIPRYLSNTTLETYIQNVSTQGESMSTICQYPYPPNFLPEGSCMSCHQCAQTAVGQNANFSFQLGRAK